MEVLSKVKIGPRLLLAFGFLVFLLGLMGLLAARQTGVIYDKLAYYTANTTPSLNAVRAWQDGLDHIRAVQAKHLLAQRDDEMSTLEADVRKTADKLQANVAAYEQLLSNDEDKRLWQAVGASVNRFLAQWEALRQVSRQTPGQPEKAEEARRLFIGESEKLFNEARQAVDAEWLFNTGLAEQLAQEGQDTYRKALLVIGVFSGAAILLGVAAAVLVARSIVRPIGQAVGVAQAVAQGNLTVNVDVRGQDEAADLLRALRDMCESLSRMVSEVRGGAENIATGAGQIATGNADLSQRTEAQASNLEETAASMEQLTGSVRSNADVAAQAHRMARDATGAVEQGGDAVQQVVSTMQDIAESSHRIGEIIGVIDGIAFQTNILALNAAVEAARAGEQGRGFAVVATEVRALAHRSAEAAKEIKQLISESTGKVEAGSQLVDAAGRSMEGIVSQVRHIGTLIEEMSRATAEQASGVAQVGGAVEQLDQVTQQNAALVEQSAAATEGLRQQAQRLAEAVQVFRLAAA